MDALIEELKAAIPLKPTTDIGDIVLIVGENPQMIFYGLVTAIERDQNKRDEWWNISLTFLTVPLQKAIWTLRTEQMTGCEIFTMGGEKRFFQSVDIEKNSAILSNVDKEPPEKKRSSLKRIK